MIHRSRLMLFELGSFMNAKCTINSGSASGVPNTLQHDLCALLTSCIAL